MAISPGMWGAAGGMAGMGLGEMMGDYKNPADAAMPYMNQIPGMLQKYLNPYISAGNQALPGLMGQYSNLMNNPGGTMNQIGSNFQQSPGFAFALQQALQGANHAAAAGGMAGSPQHEQQNMQLATNLGNQDYYNWLGNAVNMYNRGLTGQEGIYNTGAQAGIGMGEDMASVLGSQAQLAYEGQNAQNQQQGGEWGSLLGGLGTIAGFFL